ncbi:hypothetical protein CLOP_g25654 [Closterium sp. NIES-67]|nr:hypothetical protein CLOP_g25654 [Closterium sp. NIES-67]
MVQQEESMLLLQLLTLIWQRTYFTWDRGHGAVQFTMLWELALMSLNAPIGWKPSDLEILQQFPVALPTFSTFV